jgi:serine/threonine protein phosphatase 1
VRAPVVSDTWVKKTAKLCHIESTGVRRDSEGKVSLANEKGSMPQAAVPDGVRLYAIGDIHGRADLLDKLMGLIERDRRGYSGKTLLVFLGDYIDRGPDSKGVVDRLLEGLAQDIRAVFLKGNHEDLLLTFLDNPGFGLNWLYNGGDRALLSYGFSMDQIARAYWNENGIAEAVESFRRLLPAAHEDFFRSLHLSFRAGGYFFVHAGVRPGVPLEAQHEEDLLWIRKEFLTYRGDFGAVVVHGHTPTRSPENLENRIGIDTLAYHSGKLTAVGLQGTDRWFITT